MDTVCPVLKTPPTVREFAAFLTRKGFQCYLVGGAVRDALMGRESTDFDIATDALPEQVGGIFRRVIPTGLKHGTVTVLFKGVRFEVTTFRVESEYRDGRRPASVSFTPSILEDLKRRDFTINSIAFDLQTRRLLDPHGGCQDIKDGILRAIGEAEARFREDGLRPVRACRFAAQLGFQVEERTFAAIPRCLDTVAKVSAERIRDELVRLLAVEAPSRGLRLMAESGLLSLILPELEACRNVPQPEMHCFDVFEHLLASCDAAPRGNLEVRLAALLHDIGKPGTRMQDKQGNLRFHGHEELSSRLTTVILTRLKLPSAVIKRTAHLVLHHMFNYEEVWTEAAVRRFIKRVDPACIPDLFSLRRADQIGRCGTVELPPSLSDFERRIQEVLARRQALSLREIAVSGRDVMDALNLSPGPQVGVILDFLLESVLDDPELNERERLLDMAGRFYRQRLKNG